MNGTTSKNWNEVVAYFENARSYGGGQFQVSVGDQRMVYAALTNKETLEQGRALMKWLEEQNNPLALKEK